MRIADHSAPTFRAPAHCSTRAGKGLVGAAAFSAASVFCAGMAAFGALSVAAPAPVSAQAFNYGEALQKAILFYEAQRAGKVPAWNRLNWKGPSALDDGKDVGLDLSGGWYDAGDHVKFNFPLAGSVTLLAMAGVEYAETFNKTGEMIHLMNNLRWAGDYLMACHPEPNVFYGQVGDGNADHAWWGPAEVMQMERPTHKIDAANPGSDLAGETAAALAALSLLFKAADPAYAAECLKHARELYEFADKHRGAYSDAITDAQAFYKSWSGYQDELVWGAIWLFMATGENAYLTKADTEYAKLGTEPQTETRSYKWTHAWDNKQFGSYVLLAKITGQDKFKQDAERWLDYWTTGVDGQKITTTPGGLAWLDQWGSLRYSMNTSLFAFYYSDHVATGAKKKTYHDFAVRQANYTLGDNPNKRSYMVGFGENPPLNPHHRSAHGSWADKISLPEESRHILYGALVGGPGKDDAYVDKRDDFVMNEVANDYNAAYVGVLARMVKEFGGQPLADFPQPETPGTEFEIIAKINTTGNNFTEISARLLNKTAWPPRMGEALKMRYFVDLSEVFAAGFKIEDVKLNMGYVQDDAAKGAQLLPAGGGPNQYMVEIDFSGALIYPGGQSQHSKEVQFRIGLHAEAPAGSWNPDNDPSFAGIQPGNEPLPNPKMSVYEAGRKVYGEEPAGTPILSRRLSAGRTILSLRPGELAFAWPAGKRYRVFVRDPSGRLLARAEGVSSGQVRAAPPALQGHRGLALVEVEGDGPARRAKILLR